MPNIQKHTFTAVNKKRKLITDSEKDESYWNYRRKNNEAARRSRERKRISDIVLENKVVELLRENAYLKTELQAAKYKFDISTETTDVIDSKRSSLDFLECSSNGRRNKIIATILATDNSDKSLTASLNHQIAEDHDYSLMMNETDAVSSTVATTNKPFSLSPLLLSEPALLPKNFNNISVSNSLWSSDVASNDIHATKNKLIVSPTTTKMTTSGLPFKLRHKVNSRQNDYCNDRKRIKSSKTANTSTASGTQVNVHEKTENAVSVVEHGDSVVQKCELEDIIDFESDEDMSMMHEELHRLVTGLNSLKKYFHQN
ncbi:nuclear factor interleukin-3-regulated protein-like protein [Leptotrombidium deliense]|uniref:Nuclear factor interleukin-3-regulated protein-like protein n=1 Tax=Leptotrombidium deliense TaxID=299467 RepID=A0A443SB11_9ACAR|nr:nuclear factor interleukin-3-regulated protein-like protein [Leptotrombidium deliense]